MKTTTDFADLKKLLKIAQASPLYITISVILSCLASLFDGISKVLLIPVLAGIISTRYDFIDKIQILKKVMSLFPGCPSANSLCVTLCLLGLLLGTSFLQYSLSYFASLSFSYQIRTFSNNLRKAVFNRYLSFGKSFFDKESLGHINNVLINFNNFVEVRLLSYQRVFTDCFRLIIYFTILVIISWQLTALVIVLFPILYYLVKGLRDRIGRTSRDLADLAKRLNKKIINTLSNIQLIKSYASEDLEQVSFDKISDANARMKFSINKKMDLINPVQNMFIVIALIFLVLAVFFITRAEGHINVVKFLIYPYLIKGIIDSMAAINNSRVSLSELSGPVKDILSVFNDEDKSFIRGGNAIFTGLHEEIKFNRLNFSYTDNRQILKDVIFTARKGEITAIVGPTGSGKTTIINLLLRFYDCPVGSILIDGKDIRDFTLRSLMSHMALVSQNTMLFNDTLKNNIIYGLTGVSEERLIDSLKKARLYDFVSQLPQGANTLIGDDGIRLSGGERQRASIARALLKNAEILILDEATSSLDSKTEKLIQEAIEEVIKDKTAIIIAHRLSTIRNSNKIVVIEDGRVLEEGRLEELLNKKGKFYQYWEDQRF